MPTWKDLPLYFKICLVELLDYKSRCRLRQCSTSEKLIVDSSPLRLDYVKLEKSEEECSPTRVLSILPRCIRRPLDPNFTLSIKEHDEFYPDTCSLKTNQFSEFLSLFTSPFSIVDRLVFKGFENPKSRFKFFQDLKKEILEKREANYDLFDLKIRAKSVSWCHGKEILDVLEFFDANVLRRLCIADSIPGRFFKKLVVSEHWKKLKRVMFASQMDLGIEHFLHLERYDIRVKELRGQDVWRVVQKFLFQNSRRLSGFTIFHSIPLSIKEIFKHTIIPMKNEPVESTWDPCHHTQRFRMTTDGNIFVLMFMDGWIKGFVGVEAEIAQEYLRFVNDFF